MVYVPHYYNFPASRTVKKPKKQKTTLSVVHSSGLASNVIPIIKNIFFDTMSKEIFISKANLKNSSKYVIERIVIFHEK